MIQKSYRCYSKRPCIYLYLLCTYLYILHRRATNIYQCINTYQCIFSKNTWLYARGGELLISIKICANQLISHRTYTSSNLSRYVVKDFPVGLMIFLSWHFAFKYWHFDVISQLKKQTVRSAEIYPWNLTFFCIAKIQECPKEIDST